MALKAVISRLDWGTAYRQLTSIGRAGTLKVAYRFERMSSPCWKKLNQEFTGKREQFLSIVQQCEHPILPNDFLKEVLVYNMNGGKRIRGTLVAASLDAFSSISDKHFADHEERFERAHMIGWCVEMLHAGFLVLDDIIDNSPTRRNRPSWFKVQQEAGHGLVAVNDGLHLVLASKYVLHKLFDSTVNGHPSGYSRIIRLWDEICHRTCWGQGLDVRYAGQFNDPAGPTGENSKFTTANFNLITQWKTGYYTFYLPIACGMALAGLEDSELFQIVERLSMKLGQYFQAQDDYLDCYGDVETTGKVGTDIAEGKCSWLLTTALTIASVEQTERLKKYYGHSDSHSQDVIRKVYAELELSEKFRTYEMHLREEIVRDIEALDETAIPRTLFQILGDILFRRFA